MHRFPLVRLAWFFLGAAAGITLALRVAGPPVSPVLLASLGGSTVFLFGLTRAPAAQPRALFGGHLGCAFVGIFCYHAFGDALWVYGLAQASALAFMLVTRTVHPPAGANPILMIFLHAGWAALFQPVLVGIASLVAVAMIWSRLFPGLVHYPVVWSAPSPERPLWGGWEEPGGDPDSARTLPRPAGAG